MAKLDTLTPKPKTYIAIILDKSGSMYGREQFAINSFNEQVQVARAAENQDIKITLTEFNHDVNIKVYNQDVGSAKEILLEEYKPNGGTALNDAIGYTVGKLRQEPDIEEEHVSVLVIVISDGYENSSKEYKHHNIKDLIGSLEATNHWTFTYIGTNDVKLSDIQATYGFEIMNMTGSAAFASMDSQNVSTATTSYLGARGQGMTRASSFYTAKTAKPDADEKKVAKIEKK